MRELFRYDAIRHTIIADDCRIGLSTRHDAIDVMLQFMMDTHDSSKLSDNDIADRLDAINSVLERIDGERHADELIHEGYRALDAADTDEPERTEALRRAHALYDEAKETVDENDYPYVRDLGQSIYLAD